MRYQQMIEIEEEIIKIFDRRRQELNMTIETLGRMVYPTDASPRMRIQSLRKMQANGKKRRLPVGDFISMCKALELDYVRVLIEAVDKK